MSAFVLSVVLAAITGTVTDQLNRPLPGVHVAIGSARVVTTGEDGSFSAEVPSGTYVVRFTHPAFEAVTRVVASGQALSLQLMPAFSESIVVSGIRAEDATPVTKSYMGRPEIEKRYHQQDIPLLLRDTPSVSAWAESGSGGSGYSYITLRGIGASRINFTLDGVPLADSEDFGTYFVDFPDLAHSLESIQVQRGVGTSTVGSPAFAGSVNMESISLSHSPETSARLALGSFGTRFATAGYQTGSLPGGFALYSRLSYNESDGFRDSSAIEQRNLFLSAAKTTGKGQIRLTGFSGHMKQQLSFYAADAETLETNVRANPLRPDERDDFGYDLAQLQYLTTLRGSDLTASAYYQRGYGSYRLFDYGTDDLRQYGLDGMLLGTLVTLSRRSGNVTTNYGVHVNHFEREHTRDLVNGGRDYENAGRKREANAFAKVHYGLGALQLYGDAQVRYSDFSYDGDVNIEPLSWTFFNPKAGFRYQASTTTSVYVSAGISSREPTRTDLFLGEDNPTVSHDLRAVSPERVLDVEAGFERKAASWSVAANLYWMRFRNEIAATGELSEIGLPLRRNVDRSSRRGVEIDASWQPGSALRLRSVASLSRNRIDRWLGHRDVQPLLTPAVMVSQAIDYTPSAQIAISMIGRYTGRSWLENTNDPRFAAPSFVSIDASGSYSFTRALRLSLQINNLLNNERMYPNGYVIDGLPYYFPQATRNFTLMLDFDL